MDHIQKNLFYNIQHNLILQKIKKNSSRVFTFMTRKGNKNYVKKEKHIGILKGDKKKINHIFLWFKRGPYNNKSVRVNRAKESSIIN